MKYKLTIIISIVVAIACMIIGFFNSGNVRLIFAIIAAVSMTFALFYDMRIRKKER